MHSYSENYIDRHLSPGGPVTHSGPLAGLSVNGEGGEAGAQSTLVHRSIRSLRKQAPTPDRLPATPPPAAPLKCKAKQSSTYIYLKLKLSVSNVPCQLIGRYTKVPIIINIRRIKKET